MIGPAAPRKEGGMERQETGTMAPGGMAALVARRASAWRLAYRDRLVGRGGLTGAPLKDRLDIFDQAFEACLDAGAAYVRARVLFLPLAPKAPPNAFLQAVLEAGGGTPGDPPVLFTDCDFAAFLGLPR